MMHDRRSRHDRLFVIAACVFSVAGILFGLALLGASASAQQILVQEGFDDPSLAARGWYDNTAPVIDYRERAVGRGALAFTFPQGATQPIQGGAMRIGFDETDTVYVSFLVKYSSNWQGSNRAWHPHEIYLLTNQSDRWAPPAHGPLTVYIEQNEGEPLLAIQDSANIDVGRIGEDLSLLTENRSVAGCNGDNGDGGVPTCYPFGEGHRNGRFWRAGEVFFGDSAPRARDQWHRVEVLVRLNSIQGGRAASDGILRYWWDGVLIIDSSNAVLRTARHPDMRFNQLLIGPYIGDGSPVEQTFWLDDLLIATSRPEVAVTAGAIGSGTVEASAP